MKRALVLYHSLFGNTKTVAMSLARGIERLEIEVDVLSIDEVDIKEIPEYNFVAIGSPTHNIKPSKEMKEFLKKLGTIELKGQLGFSFDTRNESRMNNRNLALLENSAARSIEGFMKRMKMRIIKPRFSAIVYGREGPLNADVEEVFLQIGREIGSVLAV
ncbi:MAG: flavodoxin family protein [Candidatus Thorarchaeota archaeon]|nr:flavodoxin family protein [Candidatus Thorarchaeota archaeon]